MGPAVARRDHDRRPRRLATDHVAGGGTRVTTFKRSNQLYALAMSVNRSLDRDHDGIACEQA
jgi:hypothetical protein